MWVGSGSDALLGWVLGIGSIVVHWPRRFHLLLFRDQSPISADLMGWSRRVCRIGRKWENDGVVVFLSRLGRC